MYPDYMNENFIKDVIIVNLVEENLTLANLLI